MSELPFEIITDILSRVPVKPLLRFRCVSESWCALIDTPNFIKTHLNRSIENNTNLTLILEEIAPHPQKNTLYSLDFYSLDTPIAFKNYLKDSHVLNSCNGLLLLKPRDRNEFVLFNPSTRQHRDVPTPPIEYHPVDGPLIYLGENCGLGYDSINDDYKVIKLVGGQLGQYRRKESRKAMVYSLKSNLWRKIGDFPYLPVNDNKKWDAHVNGALHMLVGGNFDSSSSSWSSQLRIAAFDVAGEHFYLVPEPDFMQKEGVVLSVNVLGGCLCLQGTYPHYIDVWVMKVYGMRESWTKLLYLSSPRIESYVWVHPLYYSKSGDEVLVNFHLNKFIWCNLKRMEIKEVEICDLSKMFFLEVCVGSLVPVHGYAEVVNPRKNISKIKKKPMSNNKRANVGHTDGGSSSQVSRRLGKC